MRGPDATRESSDEGRGYRFGSFTLDLERGALLKAGQEVPLRPKSFEVLCFLVRHRGKLLSRQAILKAVWPDVIVTEDSLTQCVVEIRRALEDTDGAIVRTVPRRGLIFEAPVTPAGQGPGTAGLKWGAVAVVVMLLASLLFWRLNARVEESTSEAVLADTTLPNSIAVLAFRDLTPEGDRQWLADGLAEELLNLLAQVPGLTVIARTSSFSFREAEVDVVEIARRLRVAYLVEGSVRRHGDGFRVTAQLVDGHTGVSLWNETFELGPRALLPTRQSMVFGIVQQVLPGANVPLGESTRAAESAGELMLLARHYEQRVRARQDVDSELLARAIDLYGEATRVDPTSAVAHSRLAGALLYRGDLEAARLALDQALALDPDSADVQNNLGLYYLARGRPEAGAAFARAVELNPNHADALHNYAHWRWHQLEQEGVADLYRRALELDPLSLGRYGALGSYLAKNDGYDEARAVADRVEALFDDAAAYQLIADLRDMTGDVDEAIAWTLRARDAEPGNETHRIRLAELFIDIGEFETALTIEPHPGVGLLFKMRSYPELIDLAELQMIEMPEDRPLRYLLGFAYMTQGCLDSAIHVLHSTGLPDSYIEGGNRDTVEAEGFQILANAYYAAGDVERARELATWRAARGETTTSDWWVNLMSACEQAMLGQPDEAIRFIERAQQGRRLPWAPFVRDLPCLDPIRDDPEYLATLQHYESLRQDIRRRLPDTLAAFGVSL